MVVGVDAGAHPHEEADEAVRVGSSEAEVLAAVVREAASAIVDEGRHAVLVIVAGVAVNAHARVHL